MRAFVTGGAGFIGAGLVRQLRARGDDVVAIVRDVGRAGTLRDLGCELVQGDLATIPVQSLSEAMRGSDAVFHLAGSYRVGIPRSQHPQMRAANVSATERTLEAATTAGVLRIVYASTVNVFGDTQGVVVDETYRRPQPPRFLSYYDETKYLAHLAAEERIAAGAPIVIAMPGVTYGPGDPSQAGASLRQAMDGTLRVMSAAGLGGSFVHVEDVAAGMLLVHDRGRVGGAYVLGGEIAKMADVVCRAARIAGKRPPRLATPAWVARAAASLGGVIGPWMRDAPNLRELVSAGVGVTYWASSEKACRELGYAPRDLDAGLRSMLPSMLGSA